MKSLVLCLGFLCLILSCEPSKSTVKPDDIDWNSVERDTIIIKNEEVDYEIMIVEIGFDNWLMTQKPMGFYSQTYLENKNRYLVSEWNRRVMFPAAYNPNLYNQPINYLPNIDYGMEVNYLLFMYFEFFQKKYKQQLR